MERIDFILKLFELYSGGFTEKNKPVWREAYERVLPINADFNLLYEKMLNEYSGTVAPKPAWLKERIVFKYAENQESGLGHINCLLNGQEYKFAYLKSEMSCNQAMANLRKQMEEKGHKVTNMELVG